MFNNLCNRDKIDPNEKKNSKDNFLTPQGEITKVQGNNTVFEISQSEILEVLDSTVGKYFVIDNFSIFNNNEKDVIIYFSNNEKKCMAALKTYNFNYEKNYFFNNFIKEAISEIFYSAKEIEKERNTILDKLNKIRKTIKSSEIDENQFNLMLHCEFNVSDFPLFLIESDLIYIKNYNYGKDFDKQIEKIFNKDEECYELINAYKLIKNDEKNLFKDIKFKNIIFKIFLLSNNKYFSSNNLNLSYLENNYDQIVLVWFQEDINSNSIKDILNYYIYISDIDTKNMLDNFYQCLKKDIQNNKIKILTIIASLFYCCMFKMKDIDLFKDNNLGNSRINNIFLNVIKNLNQNIPILNENIYKLIYNLYTYVIQEEINKDLLNSENESFDFNKIEEKLIKIDNIEIDKTIKARYEIIKDSFKPNNDVGNTLLGKFLGQIKNIINKDITNYTDILKLSPFNKKIYSNTLTIFVSGFGSEKDIHQISWKNFIDYNSTNSMFYFYEWPSESVFKIIARSVPFKVNGVIVFDSDLPQVFIESKEKAKKCGKLLALILQSRKFFPDFQINLVAFSLGTHLVKHCLKEMHKNNAPHNIINNIILMGGATTFKNTDRWSKVFNKLVSGRIINCYSKKDNVLGYLYRGCMNKIALGRGELKILNKTMEYNIIENFDFTEYNMGHLDYRDKFKIILEKIKLI